MVYWIRGIEDNDRLGNVPECCCGVPKRIVIAPVRPFSGFELGKYLLFWAKYWIYSLNQDLFSSDCVCTVKLRDLGIFHSTTRLTP